ncbi:NAD(P)H-binding protein [Frankia sp. CNm7]|uniref:NAD(P)H-binding protein n=1 Tax=Frankia nepalensis TaxID=1836974 RepID=A0A937RGS1_9ACTN|nr:NAD(P)H-binding protein [Frankia nepalensis]MBL7497269.1 NAD(P)H-binding protein [Frankia nepalensis]MBL7512156.1 NAD(P)H-binding protein [Frankia nepalensis]MBL7520381.1 NAD(P)H-binding protein [Frankia nepalensis]MBL7631926.1 NAD(P)H-binding protein [Frankia nepalensis]
MIVVTGATGNIGRHLARNLLAAGETVTAVSRGASAPLPVGAGLTAVRADLAEPESLTPALRGADALFLLVHGSGDGLDAAAILDTAQAAGVHRVVLLSSVAAGTRPDLSAYDGFRALEDAVTGSSLEWTILRPGGFHSNALAWAPSVQAQRTVFAPYGDVALPSVDPADLADVAAAALLDPRHAGQIYVLAGPSTSPRDRATALGVALGEPVTFVEISREQAREQMVGWMPASVADDTLTILGSPTAEESAVGPDLTTVLGRPGRAFAAWARDNLGAFR